MVNRKGGVFIKNRNVVTIIFPSLFMTIITIISFSNMLNFNVIEFKGSFILSLILLFPLLFLLQGIISAVNNTNVLLALGISTLDFIILMMVYLNDSASIYILIYLVFGLIGYIITKSIIKIKISKKIK
ncbi:hypothetical protein BJV45_000148 [Clostridium saccharoperbutylacetonicum]|uniref:Uncharacterized protein n=1 Tax=Clostridium saccharoperbutylacetonicum N1-4(HMT) TaxID=931276 RepID=M1LP98_9CLOT|nr:hypothetical protein Cspa_c08890 [Clostridium saccharoperbutylacetonicum N1-4(HMT)]NRT58814.1 hypothetical protein [Clostridium saccharoperbutylacetonicum]NSB28003.1 hypothetical protein [Clostridium saccharoperbutylacetonicum]